MSQQRNFESGACFIAFVHYDDKTGGKNRPVVLIHDKEEEQFFTCKVTSQINKPLNQKYGYKMEDWKEAGLNKPSIIKCNKKDMHLVKEPFHLIKKIGDLTSKDLEGLLVKVIKVRFLEYRKENASEYER